MILTITLILTFLFFSFYQPAQEMFSSNFEITYIFQCLKTHFYLIHVYIFKTKLYQTHDSVCNYTFSYRNSQLRRRIGIVLESFFRAPFWCDAGQHSAVAGRNWNINAKLVKYPFRFKYRVNVCPRNLNKFYTICCMFVLLFICLYWKLITQSTNSI